MNYLRQPSRFVVFGVNLIIFYGFYVWATGSWQPTGGGETLWFISAGGWWALGLLSAPWYRPPRDALGASVAALLGLLTLDRSTFVTLQDPVSIAYHVAIAYSLIVLACACVAAGLKYGGPHEKLRSITFSLTDRLAKGEVLFGSLALISIFGFYQDPTKVFVLITLWAGFALLKPTELILQLTYRLFAAMGARDMKPSSGIVRRVDHPNIVRVSLSEHAKWRDGTPHMAFLPGGRMTFIIPLLTQIQDNELVGTGYCHGDATTELSKIDGLEVGHVYFCESPDLLPTLIRDLSGTNDEVEVVGFVVEGSTIGAVRFEVAQERGLEEGVVVFCNLPSGCVYYQILDALTAEESFTQNPRGTHIVHAVQLGTLDSQRGFQKFPWLPPMNTPVFRLRGTLKRETTSTPGEFIVGEVPGTNIGVKVSIPELVEFHCAILGVTGTGKTELALDIVREALTQKTKVFCVDLTGEYRQRLADRNPHPLGLTKPEADDLEAKLFAVETGQYGAGQEKKALKTFIDGIKGTVRSRVKDFLESEDNWLTVFELSEVTNTRATLRTTELYLSEIMLWARQHRKARRVLILLEEAHTIIPETAGSGFDYDTQWVVGRIGQIALQGRKYGVGLMIVSQRTALVSKTILSQCNTYFTHSLVDQTSLGYLANIYSADHVRAIPNLRFLEFLAVGKAVRSERPMLVRRAHDEEKRKANEALNVSAALATGTTIPAAS